MRHVLSKDGTAIAFEQFGEGPPVVLVVGAFNTRSAGAALAASMAGSFAVFTYDRRGRGDSCDTAPYAPEREIEDLDAVIREAGGSAAVFGYSSGACLALQAAAYGLPITRLALYEAPYVAAESQPDQTVDHAARLAELIGAGRRGDAVEYYQSQIVGIPDAVVAELRHAPFRQRSKRWRPPSCTTRQSSATDHCQPRLRQSSPCLRWWSLAVRACRSWQ